MIQLASTNIDLRAYWTPQAEALLADRPSTQTVVSCCCIDRCANVPTAAC